MVYLYPNISHVQSISQVSYLNFRKQTFSSVTAQAPLNFLYDVNLVLHHLENQNNKMLTKLHLPFLASYT